MDRIDKFLNRRKQRNKRVIKSNNKYYEITKEDIKMVRKYKKNVCLDSTVDMYRPYNLEFSRDTQETPLNFAVKPTNKKNEEKINKKFVKKHEYVKSVPIKKNVIGDIWDEDLEEYEQNLVLDINEQFTGKLGDLKMNKEDLEKELRTTYLRQYLPREKKTFKISDIIKNNTISEDISTPKEVSKFYNVSGKIFLSENNECVALVDKKNLKIYELKNFYKVYDGEMPGLISKVEFGETIRILLLCETEGTKICELCLETQAIRPVCENNGIVNFSCDKYNLFITSKSVKMMGTNESLKVSKIDKLTNIKTKDDLMIVTTTNSLKIYNITTKSLISDCKIFSYIIDFTVYRNLIFLINNLRKIVIYDYERNVVIHTMAQDCDVLKISYNPARSLLAVSTENDILIFYINIGGNQFALVNRIKGKYENIQFDQRLPWLFTKKGDRLLLYT
ncbi:WD40 repeat domain-containing protein [Vairimorpha necatrix]|uniref:WD40 repeat domain-containing protein n=1 Tax=Vairimorpha necatrix TaxID=6039 RepID=A0AAX4JGP6_9MICR